MALTREEILARKLGHTVFDLPDGSGSVVLRALSRDDALTVREAGDTTAERDNMVLHLGLVEPELSVEDAAAWAANDGAGVLTAVSEKISEISGMSEGAGKSGVSRSRKRPRS